ncbi:MAG: single-stranded-DNA-specific exonuclease RecJ [Idiomarina sp.]|uniref:Single-stranded-DNA-specific exonuclease RecJ n=1 Tax=Idiomarina aquatica TaxID=1327752 RepID=A0A4R6PRB9_9GAMM|nr:MULTISPECIES: single-stranded-DNA-specific exonuclease RecJ [Idiomarina]MBT41879.1 single-stranded-DNA-specific exonuclease RecJ [Idiomarina sp.]TDP40484.1 exonuclease RecJ [Idiomarina aquatica]
MTDFVIRRHARVDDSHLPETLPPLIRQIYARRGVESAEQLQLSAKGLLHFDSLQGVDKAIDILVQSQHRHITICGDFDADGATSTALLVTALTELGFTRVNYRVPNRMTEGYGLSVAMVEQLAARGTEIIITVDNGIAANEAAERAQQLGLQVIITDHHLAPATLPPADAIVNPNQPGCNFASKNLAGVGVAFYLMLALRARFRELGTEQLPSLANWLDLVALGTVADVVPLDYNNRIMVQQGLARIRHGVCRPGIAALLEVAGRDRAQLQAADLGFALAPRINAAGRLDDISLGIECLLADGERAAELAQQLDQLNRERRSIEAGMREHAEQIVSQLQFDNQGQVPDLLTLYEPDWHAGVIGIVAGRLKDNVNRPVVVFASEDEETLKGSARSVKGLHIRDLLERIDTVEPGIITRFGGHAMAAGLTLPKHKLSEFTRVAQAIASDWLTEEQKEAVYWSDGELNDDQLSLDSVLQLQQAGPWGQGFPEPLFDGQFYVVSQRIVGSQHLKLVLRSPAGGVLDAIAFNVDTQVWPNESISHVEILYKPQLNHFRGRTNVQLLVEQIRQVR